MSHSNLPDPHIREKVLSGEFFDESLEAYHITYHDMMSERYFFILIMTLSTLTFFFVLSAMILLYPLKKDVPFIFNSNNVLEDYPKIKPLGARGDDTNALLKNFLVTSYLQLYESYDVNALDRNALGVKGQSTKEVYAQYQAAIDPGNPESPITKFQRQAVRNIIPTGYEFYVLESGDQRAIIHYKEQVVMGADISVRKMRANITFRFDDVQVDQKTGAVTPLHFVVVGYKTEALS